VAGLPVYRGAADEAAYLDEPAGRQLLHVTFGSVLTHPTLKPRLLETLQRQAALHQELLERHLGRHLQLLSAG
jgi:hypothetical protein